jgi:signal recognition particle subunit SRP19
MRKQDKSIIWPVYFDSRKTRGMGRRVPKNLAVKSPKIDEIAHVVSRLGFQFELVPEVSYPKKPWKNSGLLLVEKKLSKELLIKKIARKLLEYRNNSPRKRKK